MEAKPHRGRCSSRRSDKPRASPEFSCFLHFAATRLPPETVNSVRRHFELRSSSDGGGGGGGGASDDGDGSGSVADEDRAWSLELRELLGEDGARAMAAYRAEFQTRLQREEERETEEAAGGGRVSPEKSA